MRTLLSRPAGRRTGLCVLAPLVVLALAACRDEPPAESRPAGAGAAAPSVEDTVLRERAVALYYEQRDRPERALTALEPLLARERPAADDLLLAASLALRASDLERARRLLARAETAPHGDATARLSYLQARLAHYEGDLEGEVAALGRALAHAPNDPASKLALGTALVQLDEDTERARELLRDVVEIGAENGTPWVSGAAYQLMLVSSRTGDEEASRRYNDLFTSLDRRGLEAPTPAMLDQGTLARIVPPPPTGTVVGEPEPPTFEADATLAPELAGASELSLDDLDGDRRPDVLAWGPTGLFVTSWDGDALVVQRVAEEDVRQARAFDLHNDGDTLDLVFAVGSELRLLEQEADGAWTPSPVELPALPAPPADQLVVDFDHDGDLDLLVVGPFGARLLRNDGAARLLDASGAEYPRGGFTDVTAEAGLAVEAAFAWCATEDFDADQDVDLLLGGPDALLLASNLRGGRFEDVTRGVLGDARLPRRPVLADFDGDARVDLFEPGDGSTLWLQEESGAFRRRPTTLAVPESLRPVAADLDLDGALDLIWPDADRAAVGVLACGLPEQRPVLVGRGRSGGALAAADLDFAPGRRCDVELVQLVPDGLRVWRVTSPVGNATRFKFVGRKDNRQAVGAIVEVRAGPIYRRIYDRGRALEIGYGDREKLDVVRITWPNGVVQSLLDVEPGDRFPPTAVPRDYGFDTSGVTTESVAQDEGLVGSCPFLYTWNGTTFTFVSDVLGITPLGLPMAPGVLVPPDHDEFVLVRGDQLVPRDGRLVLQVTEELREVTYLDHVRLQAVDHPAGTEIFPDERFTFPPFPEPHVHTVREPLAPRSALDGEGRDWTGALAALDDVHAVPFVKLPPQFQGLTPPHVLELAFDADAVRNAERLRLVCTGWLRWSNASVNVAAARTPGVAFVPPTLQVPAVDDPERSGWVDAGPPVGFPAGKTKTMVIDVSSILRAEDPRLRIASTLELYWDRIVLAVDGDDAPLAVHELPAVEARLGWRGFSAPLPPLSTGTSDNPLPERFDWERVESEPRWNQHPGLYTRYGDCRPLVDAVDDRFVLLGAGDALALEFDARTLPPVPAGFVRDWLVYLDGWAKDRDPNTVEALAVEPLPFHGMSGYPYGKDESFPDDAEHRAWRREWNTRPAYRSIVPLAPDAERAWALEETP